MNNPIMNEYTFYCTFGSGQPNYPGFYRVAVEAVNKESAKLIARTRMNQATNKKWSASMYDSTDDLHPMDRFFRGEA